MMVHVQGVADLAILHKDLIDSAVAEPVAFLDRVVVIVLGCMKHNAKELGGVVSGTVYLPPGVSGPWVLVLLCLPCMDWLSGGVLICTCQCWPWVESSGSGVVCCILQVWCMVRLMCHTSSFLDRETTMMWCCQWFRFSLCR